MNASQIGLSTGCFYSREMSQSLREIRDGGFDLVEICFSPERFPLHDFSIVRKVASHLKDLGMTACSLHAKLPASCDLSALDPDLRERARNEIMAAASAASLLEAKCLVIHPGPETEIETTAPSLSQRARITIDQLATISERCAILGVECLLENRDSHHLFGQTNDLLRILAPLKRDTMGACLDAAYEAREGELGSIVPKILPRLELVHVHDTDDGGKNHLPPGDGTINWRTLLIDLKMSGFEKPIILEITGSDDANATMSDARRGRAFLKATYRWLALAGY